MRSRFFLFFSLFWALGIGYAASSAPANPFQEGLVVQAPQQNVASIFVHEVSGAYINLLFEATPPYNLLSSSSSATTLAMEGLNAIAAEPSGPPGVGLQSQFASAGFTPKNGGLQMAVAFGSSVAVYTATKLDGTVSQKLYPVGTDPNSVFTADFNRDGNPDVAVAFDGGQSPGGIAILLGNGDGTFGTPQTYASGNPATNFAVLDLNHDGYLDIALVTLRQTVAVILGKGDGTFGAATTYSVGGSGQAIAIADVNGDGNPDLIVGGTVGVLLGDGTGNFHPGTPLPAVASGSQVWTFAAGDLNGDNKVDLVFADISNQVMVPMLGNGDGTFQPGQAYLVDQLPNSIVLTDFNNDGHLDIVDGTGDQRLFAQSENSSDVVVLLGNGDGTFQGAPAYFPLPSSQAAGSSYPVGGVAVGKFTGSSPSVLASNYSQTLSLFSGNGKGQLSAPVAVPFAGATGGLAAADFNGDGFTDAAAADVSNVAILLGGSGGLTQTGTPSSGLSRATAIAAADFNGDNKPDLAVMGSGSLAILLGKGDGTFLSPTVTAGGSTTTSLAAVDLNGDKRPDLVFADSGSNGTGGISVMLNLGAGGFGTAQNVFPGIFPAVGVGDVNGDGKPDLVVVADVNTGGAQVSWLQGKGDGTFQAPVVIASLDVDANSVLVQDFNGDGNADIVLAQQSGSLVFLAGLGNGAFSAPLNLLGGAQPTLLASGDFNGDGRPDLVVGAYTLGLLINQAVAAQPARVYSSANAGSTIVAPGSLASAFGTDLANSSPGSTSLPSPDTFGGTTVSILDSTGASTPAPLLYVVPGQVNFEVPPGVATGPAQAVITSGDGTKSAGSIQIQPVAPGLFDFNADGLAAAYLIVYHADGSNTFEPVYATSGNSLVAAPVSLGSPTDQPYLFLFGTGIAAAGTSGVQVSVGGMPATVKFAGAQGVYAGLDQVNVLLPQKLAGSGSVVVLLTANGIAANAVNFTIQ